MSNAETVEQLLELTPEQKTEVIKLREILNDPERIESELLELAGMGGVQADPIEEQPVRWKTNRLALSEDDIRARKEFIEPRMSEFDLIVEDVMGTIGVVKGKNPDLAPLAIISHTDTVPNGDMYDGVVGVMGGLEVVRAMKLAGIEPERTIYVVALTGEESSRFDTALFGSKRMFSGLDDDVLDSRKDDGPSIREELGDELAESMKRPVFGDDKDQLPMPGYVVELHVEQFDSLEKAGVDLGVVEAIAAPRRFKLNLHSSFALDLAYESDTYGPTDRKYYRLKVHGVAGHSGATPMGEENRKDGLVHTMYLLERLSGMADFRQGEFVDVGKIEIDEEAINKIPGKTESLIRLSGKNEEQIDEMLLALRLLVSENDIGVDVQIEEVDADKAEEEMEVDKPYTAYLSAADKVGLVKRIAESFASEGVVGTVGTYNLLDDRTVDLGVDIRGIDPEFRNTAILSLLQELGKSDLATELPGGGDPVPLDPFLVDLAMKVIGQGDYATVQQMISAAGHDAQNAAREGIPTVMLFTQSQKGGAAHNPDAYTDPVNLAKGFQGLGDLVYRLVT